MGDLIWPVLSLLTLVVVMIAICPSHHRNANRQDGPGQQPH